MAMAGHYEGDKEGQAERQHSNKRQRRQSPLDVNHWPAQPYDPSTTYQLAHHYDSQATPAAEENDPSASSASGKQMRLVKVSSDILPDNQQVAIIDAGSEGTSIGRDKAFTPRIRLPVMEISKHHTSLFMMKDNNTNQEAFHASDMGSTYGTFLLRAAQVPRDLSRLPPTSQYRRLSEAKKSSGPCKLAHGDVLRVGHTTFVVHIHSWPYSCQQCSLHQDGSNEIPLHSSGADAGASTSRAPSAGSQLKHTATPSSSASTTYAQVRGSGDRKLDAAAQRKRQMAELRSSYLSGAGGSSNQPRSSAKPPDGDGAKTSVSGGGTSPRSTSTSQYQDRAAQRRAQHPNEPAPSMRSAAVPQRQLEGLSYGPRSRSSPYPPGQSYTAPAAPLQSRSPPRALSADNRGYQLFAQMTARDSQCLVSAAQDQSISASTSWASQDPIAARATSGRAGLGSRPLLHAHEVGRETSSSSHSGGGGGGGGRDLYTKEGQEETRRRRYEEAIRRGA